MRTRKQRDSSKTVYKNRIKSPVQKKLAEKISGWRSKRAGKTRAAMGREREGLVGRV